MQLSKIGIAKRCLTGVAGEQPMISPFNPESVKVNGSSAGLSVASYDMRIDQDLKLGVHPGVIISNYLKERHSLAALTMGVWDLIKQLRDEPKWFALANTMERLDMPNDVAAYVVDKSTRARQFMTAFNTLADPGFRGYMTLELVNLGDTPIYFEKGDPICQMVFHQLDQPTEGYSGKYQNQPREPVPAKHE